jgi:hypothetical protein
MKLRTAQLIGCLVLGALTVACDVPAVEVSFAQPFPAGNINTTGFSSRDQGQYLATDDTSTTLLVGSKWLLIRRFPTLILRSAQLDSLALPSKAGWHQAADGQWFQVQLLATGSFKLCWEERDTLASLLGHSQTLVRHYKGWYYLSNPVGKQWNVKRVGIRNARLYVQYFNPDSLRIRALPATMLHLDRTNSQLFFTLSPQPGQQSRQVSGYNGLWLAQAEYLRKER